MDKSNCSVDQLNPSYTLAMAAKLSQVQAHSIRQYIDRGLIIPFKKNSKRHMFSDVDIRRINCIKMLIKEQGLNIAGVKALFALIPCWKIKNCSFQDRSICEAFESQTNPCWMASKKGLNCKNYDCRTCEVYEFSEKDSGPKEIIKRAIGD